VKVDSFNLFQKQEIGLIDFSFNQEVLESLIGKPEDVLFQNIFYDLKNNKYFHVSSSNQNAEEFRYQYAKYSKLPYIKIYYAVLFRDAKCWNIDCCLFNSEVDLKKLIFLLNEKLITNEIKNHTVIGNYFNMRYFELNRRQKIFFMSDEEYLIPDIELPAIDGWNGTNLIYLNPEVRNKGKQKVFFNLNIEW
jgi:hypothetical protein